MKKKKNASCHRAPRMELGQVGLDAAQEGSCLTGGSRAAPLVAQSPTWELRNSIFIDSVLTPALPSFPLNYFYHFQTLPSHCLPRILSAAAAARARLLNALPAHVRLLFQTLQHFLVAQIRGSSGSNRLTQNPWQTLRSKQHSGPRSPN